MLLSLISPVSFHIFKVASIMFKMTNTACIIFLWDNTSADTYFPPLLPNRIKRD